MRASHGTYVKVAENCSEYLPKDKEGTLRTTNSISESSHGVSCESCGHFDKEEFCRLDIYDKIVDEIES